MSIVAYINAAFLPSSENLLEVKYGLFETNSPETSAAFHDVFWVLLLERSSHGKTDVEPPCR